MNTQEKLKKLLQEAIRQFYEKDKFIIDNDKLELAAVFRIGVYLDHLLKNSDLPSVNLLNVDTEYRKHGHNSKRIYESQDMIRPDLLIHSRGNDDYNMMVAEFKLSTNAKSEDGDIKKLIALTSLKNKYQYKFGVFIKLGLSLENTEYSFFSKGERICDF